MIPIDSLYVVLLLAMVWVLIRLVRAIDAQTKTLKDLVYSRKYGDTTWLKED